MLEVYETKWRDLNLKAALKDSKIVNCSIQSSQIPLQSVVKCHELMDMVLYIKYFITIIITSTLFNSLTPIMTKT